MARVLLLGDETPATRRTVRALRAAQQRFVALQAHRVEGDDPRALPGRWGDGRRGALPRRHTVHAVLSPRHPAPALVAARKPAGR